jgi:hypothetical protein
MIGGYTRQIDEGFKKHAIEMGSGAMIYILSFIKLGCIQRLMGGYINRQEGDRTP